MADDDMLTNDELGLQLTLDVLRKRVEAGQIPPEPKTPDADEHKLAIGLVESLLHQVKGGRLS